MIVDVEVDDLGEDLSRAVGSVGSGRGVEVVEVTTHPETYGPDGEPEVVWMG